MRVADAIVSLLRREGMQRVIESAPLSTLAPDVPLLGRAMGSGAWAVAVIAGAAGWTIVKTLPLGLLGERAPASSRMRLVELASFLGTSALQVNLYEAAFLVLLEVDRQSRHLLSGYGPGSIRNPDPLYFNDEPLSEDRIDVRFELLPLQQLIWESIRYDYAGPTLDHEQFVARLARKLGGKNAACCKDKWAANILRSREPLSIEHGVTLYFERQAT
ncbi:hypothetical protein [Aureimonas altamirensis]|nr:hypothetical protein [Aureimonas altamirensis]